MAFIRVLAAVSDGLGIKMWGGMAGVWEIFVNFAVSFGFCVFFCCRRPGF